MSPICGPPPCTTTGLMRGLLQQHDVAGEAARQLLLAHGVAAVFHHDDLLVVALHVRQRLGQDAGDVVGRNGHRGDLSNSRQRAAAPGSVRLLAHVPEVGTGFANSTSAGMTGCGRMRRGGGCARNMPGHRYPGCGALCGATLPEQARDRRAQLGDAGAGARGGREHLGIGGRTLGERGLGRGDRRPASSAASPRRPWSARPGSSPPPRRAVSSTASSAALRPWRASIST